MSWDLERLSTFRCSEALHALFSVLKEILFHPLLEAGMQTVLGLTNAEIQMRSNAGFVWIGRQHRDLGNYAYAVLYQFLIRWVSFCRAIEVDALFLQLGQQFEALQLRARPTNGSWS